MAASGDAPSSEEPAQEAAAARAADGAQDMMFDELLESMMLGDDGSLSLEKNLSSLDTRTSLETTALAATGEPGWLPIATTAVRRAQCFLPANRSCARARSPTMLTSSPCSIDTEKFYLWRSKHLHAVRRGFWCQGSLRDAEMCSRHVIASWLIQ